LRSMAKNACARQFESNSERATARGGCAPDVAYVDGRGDFLLRQRAYESWSEAAY